MQRRGYASPANGPTSLSDLLFTRMRLYGRQSPCSIYSSIRSADQSPQLGSSPVSMSPLCFPEPPQLPYPGKTVQRSTLPNRLWISPFQERIGSPQPRQTLIKRKCRKSPTRTLLAQKSQKALDLLGTVRNSALSPALKEGKADLGLRSLRQQRRLLLKKLGGSQLEVSLQRHFATYKLSMSQHRPFPSFPKYSRR